MAKYFTQILFENDSYFGIIYDELSTQEIYRTTNLPDQNAVMTDINQYLINNASSTPQPKVIRNTVKSPNVGNAPINAYPCNTCGGR